MSNFHYKLNLVAVLISVTASLIATTILFATEKGSSIRFDDLAIKHSRPAVIDTQGITDPHHDIEPVEAQLQLPLESSPQNVSVSAKIEAIENRIDIMATHIEVINNTIMASPEKALAIPLLRRDVLSLQQHYEHTIQSLESDIEQTYSTMKWVIGTIVFGILGISTSVLISARGNGTG